MQGPHQVGKSGKRREFCDRSGKCREKVLFLYRGLGLNLFAS